MPIPRHEAIIRQFPENGMKLLLENPKNVRDLLAIQGTEYAELIQFERMRLVRTTFVARDYRHVEADVVFQAPLRRVPDGGRRRKITLYILIEHQSEPDRLMPLRALEYVVQIFKAQVRAWTRIHASVASLRLQPVLPVVFYTGTRSWPSIGRLADLVEMGERFAAVTPALEPLFINLPATPASRLESAGGFFGWVLRLVQGRGEPLSDFQQLLQETVRHLEGMVEPERARWLELLSYLHALVYNRRARSEREGLQEVIDASVGAEERPEVNRMGKTIADALRDEGRKEGRKLEALRTRRSTLLRQLRKRFEDIPMETVEIVETTQSARQLDLWLDRIVTAKSLEEMGIGTES
jgi:hypothetical protein